MAKKNKKDSLIGARELKATTITSPLRAEGEKAQKEYPPRKDQKELLGMSAEIANDFMYVRNTRIPNAVKNYPYTPHMRTVTKFFKEAEGGPLYIDEPTSDREVQECKHKALIMAKEGVRYCYIAKDMELSQVMAQLEEGARGVA